MISAAELVLGILRASIGLTISALIVGLLTRGMRTHASRAEQIAWALVLLQGIILVPFTVSVPANWLGEMSSATALSTNDEMRNVTAPPLEPLGPGVAPAAGSSATATEVANFPITLAPNLGSSVTADNPVPPRPFDWWTLLFGVWLAGTCLLLAVGLIRYAAFCRTLAAAAKPPADWVAELTEVLQQSRISTPIQLVVTRDLGPSLIRIPSGYRIVVPQSEWQSLLPAQRSAILRHELAHFQRGDLWTAAIARGLAVLHWFNPFAWWAVRQFEAQLEFACDSAAAGDDALVFAGALLQLGSSRSLGLTAARSARSGNLRERMQRLLQASPPTSLARCSLLIVIALLALAPAALRFRGIAQAADPAPVADATPAAAASPPEKSKRAPQELAPRTAAEQAAITARVQKLINDLPAKDGVTRAQAAIDLGKMGPDAAPAIPHLMKLFGDLLAPIYDPKLGFAHQINVLAITALSQIGEPALEPMLATVRDKTRPAHIRSGCIEVLGKMKDPRSFPALIEALADAQQPVRSRASSILLDIGDPVCELLLAKIKDPNPLMRAGVLQAISGCRNERVTPLLTEMLQDSDKTVRGAASWGLALRANRGLSRKQQTDKSYVDAQLKALETADDSSRAQIYSALRSCEDPRLEKLFLDGLNDQAMPVRWRSASGLGQLKSQAAVEPLIKMLDAKDRASRTNAAMALATIGDPRALEPLARIAKSDPDRHVQAVAARALADLQNPQRRPSEIAWGKTVNGMQLGLQCTSGDGPHRYGEEIAFDRIARNLTGEPWTIEIGVGGLITPWVEGNKVQLHGGLHVSGAYSVHRVTVPAGGTARLDSTRFILLPEKQIAAGFNQSFSVKPGTYAITTNLANFMAWSDPSVDVKKERIWRTDLVTGELKFIVQDPK